MCFATYVPPDTISVNLTTEEARRIADVRIPLSDAEILRWRRKVRDVLNTRDDAAHVRIMEAWHDPS